MLFSLIRRAAPLLAIVALTLIFFHRLALTDWILARGDTFAYFYPYWHVRDAALLAGRLPLWSPDLFMGVPLLANSQLGTFYPPNWLTISLSPPDAIRVSILLHIAWALTGAYLLARRAVGLDRFPAWVAAAVFALGGHIGAHVEQINQLQGLSWLPWIVLLFHFALLWPGLFTPLLVMSLALQFLSGHTQTVFITGVGLVVYGLLATIPLERRLSRLRFLPLLIIVVLGALLLSTPQLLPTFELMDVSNRRGGLNPNQATAFSLIPFVIGRGLLPNYAGDLFGEYIAYAGVVGLALAVVGLVVPFDWERIDDDERARYAVPVQQTTAISPRFIWFIVAVVGLFLALGEHNPLYLWLATLPGFNLFRVPARWLALFALGVAMLAGMGLQALPAMNLRHKIISLPLIAVVIGALAVGSQFATLIIPYTGGTIPISDATAESFLGWGAALFALLALLIVGWMIDFEQRPAIWGAIGLLVIAELFGASRILPYNDPTVPEAYHAERFSISQLQAYGANQTPPGRSLSISSLLFDPGDRAALEDRYAALGLSESAIRTAFVAIKQKETLADNLPLTWGIPSIDGFDGGLLPTGYYTAFTSLLLPDDELRTIDGRLRERLARLECRGACLPDHRWLNLTNTQYLITDKIFDIWHNDVAYDTQIAMPVTGGGGLLVPNQADFVADALDVVFACDGCPPPGANFLTRAGNIHSLTANHLTQLDEQMSLVRLGAESALSPFIIQVSVPAEQTIYALTLVDTRAGDFAQLAPGGWQRVLSSDVKIYENTTVQPRAFVAHRAINVADDIWGTEEALVAMRESAFDPARTVIISGDLASVENPSTPSRARITAYEAEQIVMQVEAAAPGYLVLTDAFYPGWTATINGEPAPLQRADVMFRAVPVPAGSSEVVIAYRPAWLPGALIVGGVAWLLVLLLLIFFWWRAYSYSTEEQI